MRGSSFIRCGLALAGCVLVASPAPADVVIGGVDYHTTDPGDATHGTTVEIDDSALTFLAWFDSGDEGNATVSGDVLNFLANQGATGTAYFGRNDGSGSPTGVSVTTASGDGGLSGTWALNPGTTGDVASYLLIHGGGSTVNYLYAVDTPGLSGSWDTSEAIVGPGNQSALSFLELYGGSGIIIPGGGGAVPEPSTIALLGLGIAAMGFAATRRRSKAAGK